MTSKLSRTKRGEQILDLVRRKRYVAVPELAEYFGVSVATVRRDLERLKSEGVVERFYGGARATPQAPPELPILRRSSEQSGEKQRIGREAAKLIEEGDAIFLGSGTTVLELARNLHGYGPLTIVTNSLPVVNELSGMPGITLVVLGGVLRHSELSLIGHIAEQALNEVRVQKIFMGVRAIDIENGLTNDYIFETITDRAILEQGGKLIIMADHTKVRRVAPTFLAPITSVHTFITDAGCPAEFIDQLTAQGIKVIVA